MKTHWIDEKTKYDGSQLQSLYAYLNFKVLGDSVIAWQGACSVSPEHMVDGEDLIDKAEIRSDLMLHFVIEAFDLSLFGAVFMQRLFSMVVFEELLSLGVTAKDLCREGDDLFFQDRKLSISIATTSPTSSLVHFAVNIVNEGTPVATACLNELHIEPKPFAQKIMLRWSYEFESAKEATQKVKWV